MGSAYSESLRLLAKKFMERIQALQLSDMFVRTSLQLALLGKGQNFLVACVVLAVKAVDDEVAESGKHIRSVISEIGFQMARHHG